MRFFRKLAAVLVVLGCLAGFVLWENVSVQTEEFSATLASLPAEFDGLRLVVLADLHGRQFGQDSAALLEAVKEARPDLICLPGDLFDEDTDLSMLPPLLEGLTALAPVCYVTGNHEWQVKELRQVLASMEAAGVTVLQNEYALLRRGEATLVVAGVDDPCGPADKKTPRALVEEIRAEQGDPCILMLSHRNDELPLWAGLGVDLVLSGHCHGGVVRLPFLGGVFGTEHQLFPDFDSGLYRSAQTTLFVSRGLGLGRLPFRLNNRPQLAILTLRCPKT